MTKVVFQRLDYWDREEFWNEIRDTGLPAVAVEFLNGEWTLRPISQAEFASRFSKRVASWVRSEDKTISVFGEALPKIERPVIFAHYLVSIRVGLKEVAQRFSARTAAQGKVRLPAEASFVIAIHCDAKDGSPQYHAHIAIDDRVRVIGQNKTYATDKRELYRLRSLFSAAVTHSFGQRLYEEFGVRVQKTKHGLSLPDVPKSLCKKAAVRSRQIDDYIAKHGLRNTPLTRKYGAIVTRRENRYRSIGQDAFRDELARSGFRTTTICQKSQRHVHSNEEIRRNIKRSAKRFVMERGAVTREELLAAVIESADVRIPYERLRRAFDDTLLSPKAHGLLPYTNSLGQESYTTRRAVKQGKTLAEQFPYPFSEPKAAPRMEESQSRQSSSANNESAHSEHFERKESESEARKPESDFRDAVKKALRAYRVIGAIGQMGLRAVDAAVELYLEWAKPVLRLRGYGGAYTPGSVARTVRELKPLTRKESHRVAIRAMWRLRGTLEQKLGYGEAAYRNSRRPKIRLTRNYLIVVQGAGLADPRDLRFLERKVRRTKAKLIFADREFSRAALAKIASAIRPGESLKIPTPEQRQ